MKSGQKELEEKPIELTEKAKELEEKTTELQEPRKELKGYTKELEEQHDELRNRTKELEEQPAELDLSLVKAVQLQLPEMKEPHCFKVIEEDAEQSFKKVTCTQLPQHEVSGADDEQLASEQQLVSNSLSINLGNIIEKKAAFKKMKELYQTSFSENTFSANSFSESSFSTSNLQTSLAYSMQWPSLFRKSFTGMKKHQLHQQEPAFGCHDPRACTGACKRACRHHRSFLSSKTTMQEKQLSSEPSTKRSASALQRASSRMDISFMRLRCGEAVAASSSLLQKSFEQTCLALGQLVTSSLSRQQLDNKHLVFAYKASSFNSLVNEDSFGISFYDEGTFAATYSLRAQLCFTTRHDQWRQL